MHNQPSSESLSPLRRTMRLSVTVPHHTYQTLLARSAQEGRSLSNLAAFLLESSLLAQALD